MTLSRDDMPVIPYKGESHRNWSNDLVVCFRDQLEPFLKHLLYNRGFAKNSILAVRSDIQQFIAFLAEVDIRRLQHHHIEQFSLYAQEVHKNCARTVNRKFESLRYLFRYLHLNGFVKENPMDKIDRLKTKQDLPVFLTQQEMTRLIEVIPKREEGGYRDYAIILTFLKTGLRVHEVISLTIQALNFEDRLMRVTVKGGRQRHIRMSEGLRKVIRNYLDLCRHDVAPCDAVFVNRSGKALSREWVSRMIQRYAKEAGIKKKISAHTLRHSFATDLLNKGASLLFVKEALNHKQITSTQIYTHLEVEDFRRQYDSFVA